MSLTDYTIRNITTGDEEDVRVLELTTEEYEGFPEPVRDRVRSLVGECVLPGGRYDWDRWSVNQETIRQLLLPHMNNRALYEADYAAWEQNVLDGDYEDDDR